MTNVNVEVGGNPANVMNLRTLLQMANRENEVSRIIRDLEEFGYSSLTIRCTAPIQEYLHDGNKRYQRKLGTARARDMAKIMAKDEFGKGSSRAAALSVLMDSTRSVVDQDMLEVADRLLDAPMYLSDGQTRVAGMYATGKEEPMTFMITPYNSDDELKRDAMRMDNQKKRNNADQASIMELTELIPELNGEDAKAVLPAIKKISEQGMDQDSPFPKMPTGKVNGDMALSMMKYYRRAIVCWANTAKFGTRMNIDSRVRALSNGRVAQLRLYNVAAAAIVMFHQNETQAENFLRPIAMDKLTPNSPQAALMRFIDSRAYSEKLFKSDQITSGAPSQARLLMAMLVAWHYFLAGKELSYPALTKAMAALVKSGNFNYAVPPRLSKNITFPLKSMIN